MRYATLVLCLAFLGCDSGPMASSGPAPPNLVQPAADAEVLNAVQFKWTAPEKGTQYHFQLSRTSTFDGLVADTVGVFASDHVVRHLSLETDYFWRVAAMSGSEEMWSDTRRVRVTGEASPPGRVQPALPINGALQQPIDTAVYWEPTEGATSYQLQVALDARLLIQVVDLENIAETRFAINALVLTYPYWWRVRAANPAGYGPWSSTWTFVVTGG